MKILAYDEKKSQNRRTLLTCSDAFYIARAHAGAYARFIWWLNGSKLL